MRILALDTATENCSAALLIDGHLIAREQRLEHGHAAHILRMIDAVLSESGVALPALSAIAFGRGPGAFTGVRLAASVTQGLAFGAGLAVVPISDLRALAQRALETDTAIARVLVCTDARMREVYWGCFERREGVAAAVGAEHVGRPDAVTLPPPWSGETRGAVRRPPPFGAGRVCGVGSGFAAYPELRSREDLHPILDRLLPRAAEIARLAVLEVAGGRILPPEQALPVYLRDEVASPPPPQSLN